MEYFKLFACCIPVNGHARSAIYDLQRGTLTTIPRDLGEILINDLQRPVSLIYEKYGPENKGTLEEYFRWLLKQEFGFYCKRKKEAECFTNLSTEWDFPNTISNVVVDINSESKYSISNVFEQIRELGVPYVQLRCYSVKRVSFFEKILKACEGSRIKSIEIITRYYHDIDLENFKGLFRKYLRLKNLIFHEGPVDRVVKLLKGLSAIQITRVALMGESCCGNIKPDYFSINTDLYTEGLKFNTCLNRKISIDKSGNIKNCPGMKDSFGNVDKVTLKEVLKKKGVKKYWNIIKDEVSVCKDCEFRYACTDCRAYIEDPKDIYSKPLKCGYDPYSAQWKEWSDNPLKLSAIAYYKMKDPVK